MISKSLAELLEGPNALLVASRNAELFPECSKAFNVRVLNGGTRISVLVPLEGNASLIANLRAFPRMAVTVSTMENRSAQVKGHCREIREPTAEDTANILAFKDAYARTLESVGMPLHVTRRTKVLPGVVVEMDVEQIFEQTPGPGAGKAFAS